MSLIGPSATLRPCGPCGRIALLLLSGLVITTLDIGGASAQPAPARRHEVRDPIAAHIAEAAQRFGIPERWIVAVLGAESAGDTHAVSHAGARGLMQVMPSTWDALRARYRLGLDPFDPRDNILAGAAYLREMYDRYGTIPAMLAAYNAGPARYDEHLATGRRLPAAAAADAEGGRPTHQRAALRDGTRAPRAPVAALTRACSSAMAPATSSSAMGSPWTHGAELGFSRANAVRSYCM